MRRALIALPLAALLCHRPAWAAGVSPPVVNATENVNATSSSLLANEVNQVLGDAAARFGGCALCRNSGNCSIAVDNASSGVFCGDLAASKEPCCCPYQSECRVTKSSSVCKCTSEGYDESFYRSARGRLQAEEAAAPDYQDTQMSASTEILIHLSAYLALFVIATFVDDWVDCCRDFRRSQLVYNALDKGIMRLKEKHKRRREATSSARTVTLFSDSEDEDEPFGQSTDAPLLLGMFPVARTPDDDVEPEPSGESSSRAEPMEEMRMDRVA